MKTERSTKEIITRFFEPVDGYRKEYMQASAVAATYFLFDIYTILVLQHIASSFQSWEVSGIPKVILIYALAQSWFFIRKRIVRDYWWVTIKRFSYRNTMRTYLKKYIHLDNTAVEKIGTGKLMWIIQGWALQQMDAHNELNFVVTELIIKLLFALYLVRQTNPLFVLAFILLQALVYAWVAYADKFANWWRKIRKENDLDIWRVFVRILQNKQEVLGSGKIDYEIEKITSLIDENLWFNKHVNNYVRWMFNIPLMLIILLTITIMVYTYQSILSWTFDFWLFTGLSALLWYLQQLMLKSTKTFQNITKNFTHIEKMWDFFDSTLVMQWYDQGNDYIHTNGFIDLKNIWFSYDSGEKVFESFSLQIAGWKRTALVWISGSWKSTLVKMIAWYISPDQGEIIIDGQDLSSISMKSYFSSVWYLTQEPSVFDGTILENLTYGIEDTSLESLPTAKPLRAGSHEKDHKPNISQLLQKAISSANCEFIYDLPDWLETEIGERWIRLSWGQRQRLAIAKIFLKNPNILILDEPTSALDSFSEEAISTAMHNLFTWRTVIIIAHRLQTVKEADDIILLEKGQVKERGTHHELVALWKNYAKMLKLQSGF